MQKPTDIDLDFVRSNFPAFDQPSLRGWAFFENAGGSYACSQVIQRLTAFYTQNKVQPYAPYPASSHAGRMMDESYRRFSDYLNVTPSEVSFGPSTTQNVYVLAQAFRDICNQGDEIIVTNQDHEANSGAWRKLSDSGIVIKEWQVDPKTGILNPDDLRRLLGPRTRVVAFTHCSNIVGHINPVADICELAKTVDAITVVDGVSYAGHGFPDIVSLGADIYLYSLYKTFGPHQGVMILRQPVLDELANQNHFFNQNEPQKKLIPAGPDHAQVASAAGIIDYFDTLHDHHFSPTESSTLRRDRINEMIGNHERRLLERLLEFLATLSMVKVIGPADASLRSPTVSLIVEENHFQIVDRLNEHKIMCWNGDFYSRRLVNAMGIEPDQGVLRLSFVHYTSDDDIDQLIDGLSKVLS